MKIVVLGGGLSPERQISLRTSESILHALRQRGHKAVFVDMFLGLENVSDALFDAEDGLLSRLRESMSVSLSELEKRYREAKGASIGRNVLEICKLADFVFIGLHGEDGEDGKIQGTLDLLGIPYNGSDGLGSAMAMDKGITRQLMQLNGINTAPLVTSAPCVLKLVHGGSSIGAHVCRTDAELQAALSKIQEYGDDYIIEKWIDGTEISIGVLDDKVLPPIEIIPPEGRFLDYEVKYSSGENAKKVTCPARISEELTAEVQQSAMKLHKAMKLSGYSRTDFIIDREGKIWGLEVNTLSGFTPTSLLLLAASSAGLSFGEVCETIIKAGIERSLRRRKKIVREMAM